MVCMWATVMGGLDLELLLLDLLIPEHRQSSKRMSFMGSVKPCSR